MNFQSDISLFFFLKIFRAHSFNQISYDKRKVQKDLQENSNIITPTEISFQNSVLLDIR